MQSAQPASSIERERERERDTATRDGREWVAFIRRTRRAAVIPSRSRRPTAQLFPRRRRRRLPVAAHRLPPPPPPPYQYAVHFRRRPTNEGGELLKLGDEQRTTNDRRSDRPTIILRRLDVHYVYIKRRRCRPALVWTE